MIKKMYFFDLIAILFFAFPVHAAYCPSPEAIKPACKVLVTEDMVKTTILECLKKYDLKKLDNPIVKRITQTINTDPRGFFASLYPRMDRKSFDPLVLFMGEQLNIPVSFYSNNERNIIKMLICLFDKAKRACRYTNTELNLLGEHSIDLHLARVKQFQTAYFLSETNHPTSEGILVRCEYRLENGRPFDLLDNYQAIDKPEFKLSDEDTAHWTTTDTRYLYQCNGDTVKACPFKLK